MNVGHLLTCMVKLPILFDMHILLNIVLNSQPIRFVYGYKKKLSLCYISDCMSFCVSTSLSQVLSNHTLLTHQIDHITFRISY
jgi:hypothetical protein